MARTDAYWLSSTGTTIPVERTHIEKIIDDPKKFGLDLSDIEKAFKKRKEPMGFEGFAREDILVSVIEKGWIRLRYLFARDTWTAQVKMLDRNTKRRIKKFLEDMTHFKKAHYETEMRIIDLRGMELESFSFLDGMEKLNEVTTKMTSFKNFLEESSLSRVWQHVKDMDSTFAAISAFRSNLDKKTNLKRHAELAKKIRALGLGYIETEGGFVEQGREMEGEKSYFIPNIKFVDAIELGNQYDQDSILFKDSESFQEFGTSSTLNNVGQIIRSFSFSRRKGIAIDKPDPEIDKYAGFMKDFFSTLSKGSHAKRKFVYRTLK